MERGGKIHVLADCLLFLFPFWWDIFLYKWGLQCIGTETEKKELPLAGAGGKVVLLFL